MDPIDDLRSALGDLAARTKALEERASAEAHAATRSLVGALHDAVTRTAGDLGARLDTVETAIAGVRAQVISETSAAKAHMTAMVRSWQTPALALLMGFGAGTAGFAAVEHFWR